MAGSKSTEPAARVPPAAAALVDLLNSRPHATPLLPDTLEDPETSGALLRPFGQPENTAPSAERVARVHALRTDLMSLISGPRSEDADQGWAKLSAHASTVTLRQIFSPPGTVDLRQVDGDPVVGAITLAVAQLVTAGTWSRIRACANDLCSHVFYDTTRSRTQRWDSYETCGNRTNVASYRARKNRPSST